MATGGYPTLYKGAGPGTWWHVNDPRTTPAGFWGGAANAGTVNATVRHITAYSWPSPYLSFTTSFAIARSYALSGPKGVASRSNPGFVYEIDLSTLSFPPTLIDPVQHIVGSNGGWAHRHEGAPTLIEEIAKGAQSYSLSHRSGGPQRAPAVQTDLIALVFAIRDAEILVAGGLSSAAIYLRHDVY